MLIFSFVVIIYPINEVIINLSLIFSQFKPNLGQIITRNGPARVDQRKFRAALKTKIHAEPEQEFPTLYEEIKKDLFPVSEGYMCNFAEISGISKTVTKTVVTN